MDTQSNNSLSLFRSRLFGRLSLTGCLSLSLFLFSLSLSLSLSACECPLRDPDGFSIFVLGSCWCCQLQCTIQILSVSHACAVLNQEPRCVTKKKKLNLRVSSGGQNVVTQGSEKVVSSCDRATLSKRTHELDPKEISPNRNNVEKKKPNKKTSHV